MIRKTIFALATAALVSIGSAQAQTIETLADSMRQSVARCSTTQNSEVEYAEVFINKHCVKTHFSALQTYIDKVSECIRNPFSPGGKLEVAEACKEAKILEAGLIKTFREPPKQAKR